MTSNITIEAAAIRRGLTADPLSLPLTSKYGGSLSGIVRPIAQSTGLTIKALAAEVLSQARIHATREATRKIRPGICSTPTPKRLNSYLAQWPKCYSGDLPTGWPTNPDITDRDISGRLWIVRAEYQYHYSNRAGDWWTGASYLCGIDEVGQRFAIRLPRSIRSITDAINYIEPAIVRKVRKAGQPVLRQGDVYFVPSRHMHMRDLPWGHVYDADRRIVVHNQHHVLSLPTDTEWRAVVQKSVRGRAAD